MRGLFCEIWSSVIGVRFSVLVFGFGFRRQVSGVRNSVKNSALVSNKSRPSRVKGVAMRIYAVIFLNALCVVGPIRLFAQAQNQRPLKVVIGMIVSLGIPDETILHCLSAAQLQERSTDATYCRLTPARHPRITSLPCC